MKNRLVVLLTILLMTGLWTFAQVAPAPKPQPDPRPQPQPVQPVQVGEPAVPADIVEIRVDDPNVDFTNKKVQYDRVYKAQLVENAFAPYKQKLEKGSYIGLATAPIPNVLRDQLKLPSGSGLVVERVEPASPAETAGMKVSDIIQKLDDQVLINPHQFGVLVRNLKADVEVKLSIIRETKPQTVAIKPVQKDLAPLDEAAAYGAADAAWRDVNTARTVRFGGGDGRYTLTTKKPVGGPVDLFTGIDRTEMVTDNGNTQITTTIGPKG